MSEPLADTLRPETGPGEVAVVYAGDYVNKMSGQRIERECLTRMECGCRALVISFRDTELVNSIGVSILLGVIDAAERRGARLAFSNVSVHTRALFELLGRRQILQPLRLLISPKEHMPLELEAVGARHLISRIRLRPVHHVPCAFHGGPFAAVFRRDLIPIGFEIRRLRRAVRAA